MSQRILMIESDTGFADEVKAQLELLGAIVAIEGDGPSGLAAAEHERPDLILLTIELPGMNGFLVCKKIKKHDGLKDVPLMILSSGSTHEVFEQHKKLRTRADDYLTKPVAFDDLRRRVEQFVKLNGHSNGSSAATQAEEDEEEMIYIPSEPAPEVEEFAAEAFESLMVSEQVSGEASAADASAADASAADANPAAAHSAAAIPAMLPPVRRPEMPPEAPQEGGASKEQFEAMQRELDAARRELREAQRAAQDAQAAQAHADERAASAEKALAQSQGKGTVSSRELLDLREQLNRKDRELIDLRDQVSARDKQVIEANDRNLVLERQLADVGDTTAEQSRDIERVRAQVETLTNEKLEATRKSVELQGRAERAEELATELQEQLEREKSEYADARAAIAASHAGQLDELREQHGQALAATKRAAQEEQAAVEADNRDKLEAVTREAEQAQKAALANSERRVSKALEDAALAAADERDRALAELRTELEADADSRVAALSASHKAELTAQLEQVRLKLEAELSSAKASHQQEMARVGRTLNEAQARQAVLEERSERAEGEAGALKESVAQLTAERDDKSGELNATRAELSTLRERFARDAALLERVRKALAIGMGLLEEQQRED